ncbi:MAG: hypothetical protein JWQ25_2711 [Daejeonella sp.]|nr:hypothetical protein [Daejeonella sp.]
MLKFHSLWLNGVLIILLVAPTLLSPAQVPLQIKFESIAKQVDGNVGISALILETGESASYNAEKRFPMQSVYKFPIAMAVLAKVDRGELSLDGKVNVTKSDFILLEGHSPLRDKFPDGATISIQDLLRYNVGESDGTACDVLLRLTGGTKNADDYIHQTGIKDIAIKTTEKIQVANDTIQYQNWATPSAMTELLKTFYSGSVLSNNSTALLLKLMIESSPGAKRLKGLLPDGTIVAHKTGTARTFNGLTRATNDVGIIYLPNGKHLAIAVFISDSKASQDERELTIAKIAKVAFDYWNSAKL